jgi:hypothetical protein
MSQGGLVCDLHGIGGGGGKHCGKIDAQPGAFHTAGVVAAFATLARRITLAKRAPPVRLKEISDRIFGTATTPCTTYVVGLIC